MLYAPHRLVAIVCILASAASAVERDPASLFTISPADFFAMPETQRPIPGSGREIDRALLDAAVFHATNQVRAEHKLRPLRYSPKLAEAAALHLSSMLEHNYLAHENPHDDSLRLPLDRALRVGYTPRSVSENLAQIFRVRYEQSRPYYKIEEDGRYIFSYEPDGEPIPPHSYESLARELLKEWMNSPGHRENVLREVSEELGVAVQFRFKQDDLDEALAVQVFGTPRR